MKSFKFLPSYRKCGLVFLLLLLLSVHSGWSAGGILQIRNGYFWDPAAGAFFIPHGMAYQTWNPPVGANQSFDQIDYDLLEFKKMYANSVRGEFVWSQVEVQEGVFDWSKPDHLVAKADELGLKLFILIAFQYPPPWFPPEFKGINDQGTNSDVMIYEHPEARRRYTNYIAQVTKRYKDSAAIGAWILGNEYAYFDLWETNSPHRFLGYDPVSQTSYKNFLSSSYGGDISKLNSRYGSTYTNFDSVVMPRKFPIGRDDPAYHDLIQWRKRSIGDFVAQGAIAARASDPNHLFTYSMVGGIFSGDDANNGCEDAKTIVARCKDAGVPLDFWSINNYALAYEGSEVRSADFGIAKYQAESGLPVMISETGHSSTETLFSLPVERQAKAVVSQIWESLMSGAIATHIFTWNDRDQFRGFFAREKGFGIVNQDRTIKSPSYEKVLTMFRRMEEIKIERLFGGSSNPPPDIQYFWSTNADVGWPRANQENAMVWGALKRLGYQPGIIADAEFENGAYSNAPALLLSRCFQMAPEHLDRIATNVVPAGIHVHANADLPGQFDAYHRPNPNWASRMNYLFGLTVVNAVASWDSGVTNNSDSLLSFTGVNSIDPIFSGYSQQIGTWKIWDNITATSGTTIVRDSGFDGHQNVPALQIKNLGSAKTAINTFALGDSVRANEGVPRYSEWDFRYQWLRAIYRTHFGMKPAIDLSGPGAQYVNPDYRLCVNGSILVSLLNEYTNQAVVTLSAPALLKGMTVENLTTGGLVATNSSGVITGLAMTGDDYILLYAYPSAPNQDASLVNASPLKIWIESAPTLVVPNASGYQVTVGYETKGIDCDLVAGFERILPRNKVYSKSAGGAINGKGTSQVTIIIPDADLNDPDYVSSPDGANYCWHVWLEQNGSRVSETSVPVRLVWGVRPMALPATVVPGNSYSVAVEWQELPSYLPGDPMPLDRARLWDSADVLAQHYNIVLELRSAGQVVVVSTNVLTYSGSGSNLFSIKVPSDALGPFTWSASLLTAPSVLTHNMDDSFEGVPSGVDRPLMTPWSGYVYSQANTAALVASGILDQAYDGKKSAFLIVTNPPDSGGYSGFGIDYIFDSDWAMPTNAATWKNYSFSYAFKETNGRACVLEMQLKDSDNYSLQFIKPYQPGAGQWDTITASLDQFHFPSGVGPFNPAKVHSIAANIQMLEKNAAYTGAFSQIRFEGPVKVEDSFADRDSGTDRSILYPWTSYVYAQIPGGAAWLDQGVHPEASDGSQSAFLVVTNSAHPGDYSGFGLSYVFPSGDWALPSDPTRWADYVFSFDFKDQNSQNCILEMQVKNKDTNSYPTGKWLQFTKPYVPGSNQWDSVRATLDQFQSPPGLFGKFEPDKVNEIVVNIRMLDTNAMFISSIDNIRFESPESLLAAGDTWSYYTSANDILGTMSIQRNPATADLRVSWTGIGSLLSANDASGPWEVMTNATNPQIIKPMNQRKFYQLRR